MTLREKIEKIIGHNAGDCCDFGCAAYTYEDGTIPNWQIPGECNCNLKEMVDATLEAVREFVPKEKSNVEEDQWVGGFNTCRSEFLKRLEGGR